jgi:hypothetical protein
LSIATKVLTLEMNDIVDLNWKKIRCMLSTVRRCALTRINENHIIKAL